MSQRSHTADEHKSTAFIDFRPSHLGPTWSPAVAEAAKSTDIAAAMLRCPLSAAGAGLRLMEQTTEIVEGRGTHGVVLDAWHGRIGSENAIRQRDV